MIIIGIDPGVNTGLAEFDPASGMFMSVRSIGIVQAMREVEKYRPSLAIWEDARLRTWFGTKGRESLQGAGSIKCECRIWAEFFAATGIPNLPVKPQKGATKWTSKAFAKATGWPLPTNEHGRDAAMLVWGISTARAGQMMGAKTTQRG